MEEHVKIELNQKLKEDCTFKPKINKKTFDSTKSTENVPVVLFNY